MNCFPEPCHRGFSFHNTLSVVTQHLRDICKRPQEEDVSWDQAEGSPLQDSPRNRSGSARRLASHGGREAAHSILDESNGKSSHFEKLAHHFLAGHPPLGSVSLG